MLTSPSSGGGILPSPDMRPRACASWRSILRRYSMSRKLQHPLESSARFHVLWHVLMQVAFGLYVLHCCLHVLWLTILRAALGLRFELALRYRCLGCMCSCVRERDQLLLLPLQQRWTLCRAGSL